jgi:hypothetical protein
MDPNIPRHYNVFVSASQRVRGYTSDSKFEVSLRAPDAFSGATRAPAMQVHVSNFLRCDVEIASSQKALLAMTDLELLRVYVYQALRLRSVQATIKKFVFNESLCRLSMCCGRKGMPQVRRQNIVGGVVNCNRSSNLKAGADSQRQGRLRNRPKTPPCSQRGAPCPCNAKRTLSEKA